MEFTLKTMIVIILFLVAALFFASLILGWGSEANNWMNLTVTPLQEMISPR